MITTKLVKWPATGLLAWLCHFMNGSRAPRSGRPLSAIPTICCLLFAALSWTSPVMGAPGDLDPAFGTNGVTEVNFRTVASFAEVRGVAVQSDGKVVVAGDYYEGVNTHVALLRYNANGTADSGFGSGGIVQLPMFGYEYVEDVVVQSNGKIVVTGWNDQNANDCFVARFNSNGSIDSTFGTSGRTTVEFGDAASQDRCFAVRIDSSSRIVMAGYGTFSGQRNTAVARFTSSGALDTTFGTGGKASYNIDTASTDRAFAMALQTDDKIVVAGKHSTQAKGFVARFNTNGSIDTSFNGSGYITTSLGGTSDEFRAVAIQPDGKIVAGGSAYVVIDISQNRTMQAALARFNTNGTLDTSFGTSGIAFRPVAGGSGQDSIRDLRIYDAGGGVYKILASGYTTVDWLNNDWNFFGMRLNSNGTLDSTWGNLGKRVVDMSSGGADTAEAGAIGANGELFIGGYGGSGSTAALMALLKLTAAGNVDTSFNGSGKILTQLQAGSNDQAGLVAMQSDGKVVLVGATQNNNWDIGTARLTSAGVLDTSFNTTGKTTYGNANTSVYEYPSAVGVQNDGKILVAATIGTGFGLLRYNVNGTLDSTFGTGGIASVSLGANGGTLNAIAVQPDGKIVAAGTDQATPSDSHAIVMRFNTNGSLDTGFGSSGKREWDYPGSSGFDEIAAVFLQTDGKIIVAGRYSAGTYFHGAAARLTTAGALDMTFGSGGLATFSFSDGGTELYGIGIQLDGKIILAGKVTPVSSTNDSLVARLNTNGSLDATFGNSSGHVVVPLSTGNDQATRALVRWDDKIVLVGSAFNGNNDDLGVAMLNQNGELDTTFTPSGKLIKPIGGRNDYISGFTIQQDGKWLIGGSDDGSSDLLALRMVAPPHDPRNVAMTPASDSGRSSSDAITKITAPTFTGQCFNFETVHLQVDGVDIAATTCSAGFTFSLTVPALADGSHTIRAYSSTLHGNSSFSPTKTVVIDTVALPPAITQPGSGGIVQRGTTISGNGAETTADIVVYEGAITVCTTQADASGNWSCQVSLTLGPHTIFAKQTDIAGNTSTASSSVSFTVKRPTTTVANSTPKPSTYGTSVTFGATVDTVPAGEAIPTGTVTFKANGTTFAGPTALVNGSASATTAAFDAGSYYITVEYSGDALQMVSTSPAFPHDVQKANQVIVVTTAAVASAAYNSGFTVGATGGGSGQPVTYSSTGVCINSGAAFTMTSGTGDCTVHFNQAGTSNYNAAPEVTQTTAAQKAITYTALISSVNPVISYQPVTFTATVTSSAGTPTGTVTFNDNSVAVGTGSLDGGGQTMFATSSLAAGQHPINADYSGDANFLASVSSPLQQTAQDPVVTIHLAGNGSGTVNSIPSGIACPGTLCAAPFDPSLGPVTLTVSPDSTTSTFAGWGGDCAGSNGTMCSFNADGNKDVTVSFAKAPLVMGGDTPYATIQEAISQMSSAGIIKALALEFVENPILDRNLAFVLKGGYEGSYTSNTGWTYIKGALKIRSGRVAVEQVKIR